MWREVVDDLGRTLALPEPPRRIVSLVPSVTELICDLGAGERLVGVTKFCVEPAAVVANLPRVGGTKTADCATLAALQPDLVVMNSEENDRTHFEALIALAVQGILTSTTAARRGGAPADAPWAPRPRRGAGGPYRGRRRCPAAADPRPHPRVLPDLACPGCQFNHDTYCHDVWPAPAAQRLRRGGGPLPQVELPGIAHADPQVILLPGRAPIPSGAAPPPPRSPSRSRLAQRAHPSRRRQGPVLVRRPAPPPR